MPRLLPSYTDSQQRRAQVIARRNTDPNIIALLDEHKRKTSLLIGQADPHLGVHEQSMVQVQDLLLQTSRSAVNLLFLLALLPCQAVQTEQVSILGLEDMLFSFISVQAAKIHKVGGVSHGGGDGYAASLTVSAR